MLHVEILDPAFGNNYNVGYIGFTVTAYNSKVTSAGVACFKDWNSLSQISVAHTFIVTAKDACIEASLSRGVAITPLDTHFGAAGSYTVFRKPAGYTQAIGERIAMASHAELGRQYIHSLAKRTNRHAGLVFQAVRDKHSCDRFRYIFTNQQCSDLV
jgi:hypothetical protein